MRKFLPLLLCLSLSVFTFVRATKATHPLGSPGECVGMLRMKQQTDTNTVSKHAKTEQETTPGNNDDAQEATGDDDQDANNDGDADATAADDTEDDNAADDDTGDDGGDNGGQ